jgi:hypothetical protein
MPEFRVPTEKTTSTCIIAATRSEMRFTTKKRNHRHGPSIHPDEASSSHRRRAFEIRASHGKSIGSQPTRHTYICRHKHSVQKHMSHFVTTCTSVTDAHTSHDRTIGHVGQCSVSVCTRIFWNNASTQPLWIFVCVCVHRATNTSALVLMERPV